VKCQGQSFSVPQFPPTTHSWVCPWSWVGPFSRTGGIGTITALRGHGHHLSAGTGTSTWDPDWGAHRAPRPLLPSRQHGSQQQPIGSALPSRCQQQKCPLRAFPPLSAPQGPAAAAARGELLASSEGFPWRRVSRAGGFTSAPGKRDLTKITKTSRTWLEIKRLPSLLSKTAGVELRAWAFSPSKRPPRLDPSEAPPRFHVSISAPFLR